MFSSMQLEMEDGIWFNPPSQTIFNSPSPFPSNEEIPNPLEANESSPSIAVSHKPQTVSPQNLSFESRLCSFVYNVQCELDSLCDDYKLDLNSSDHSLDSCLENLRVILAQKFMVSQYEKPETNPILQMESPRSASVEPTTLDPNGISQPSMSPGNQEDIHNGQEPFDHGTNDQSTPTPTPNLSYYCQPTSTTTQNPSVFPNDAGNQGYEGVPNDQGYFDNDVTNPSYDQLTSSSSQHLSNQDVIDSSMTIDQPNLQHFLCDFEAKNQDIVSNYSTTNVRSIKLEDRMGLALFAIDFLAQSHEIQADPQLCCRDVFYMKVEDVRKISKQLPLPKEAQNQILRIVSDLRKKVKNRGYRQKKIGVVNEPKKNPSPIEYSKLSPAFRHQLYLWFTVKRGRTKHNETLTSKTTQKKHKSAGRNTKRKTQNNTKKTQTIEIVDFLNSEGNC